MAEFAIVSKDTKMSLNDLDQEVCELFGLDVHPVEWCKPNGRSDWFDVIGLVIALSDIPSWNLVRAKIIERYTNVYINDLARAEELMRPFLNLIDYWEGKRYFPINKNFYKFK